MVRTAPFFETLARIHLSKVWEKADAPLAYAAPGTPMLMKSLSLLTSLL